MSLEKYFIKKWLKFEIKKLNEKEKENSENIGITKGLLIEKFSIQEVDNNSIILSSKYILSILYQISPYEIFLPQSEEFMKANLFYSLKLLFQKKGFVNNEYFAKLYNEFDKIENKWKVLSLVITYSFLEFFPFNSKLKEVFPFGNMIYESLLFINVNIQNFINLFEIICLDLQNFRLLIKEEQLIDEEEYEYEFVKEEDIKKEYNSIDEIEVENKSEKIKVLLEELKKTHKIEASKEKSKYYFFSQKIDELTKKYEANRIKHANEIEELKETIEMKSLINCKIEQENKNYRKMIEEYENIKQNYENVEEEKKKLNKIIKELSEKLDKTNIELNNKNCEDDKNDMIIEENYRLKESIKFYKNQLTSSNLMSQTGEIKKVINSSPEDLKNIKDDLDTLSIYSKESENDPTFRLVLNRPSKEFKIEPNILQISINKRKNLSKIENVKVINISPKKKSNFLLGLNTSILMLNFSLLIYFLKNN